MKKAKRASQRSPTISIETYVPTLITRLALRMIQRAKRPFRNYHLTIPKYRVLLAVSAHPKIRVGKLAELTRIEAPTLSRVLVIMASDGLIRRERSKTDDRSVEISLTPRGKLMYEKTLPWAHETQDGLLRGLSPRQVETLRTALRQMYKNLDDADTTERC
jgi:DNA-binding MarR family transcriptional regulator